MYTAKKGYEDVCEISARIEDMGASFGVKSRIKWGEGKRNMGGWLFSLNLTKLIESIVKTRRS